MSLEPRPPRNPAAPRAVHMWTAVALAAVLPPVITLALLTLLIPPARPWLMPWLVATAVLGAAYTAAAPRRRRALHRWEVTGDAVYTRSGCVWERSRIAPLSRVETVDSLRGPFQQLFGLAGVTVTTASAAGSLKIRGLDAEQAAALLDTLARVADGEGGAR